MKSIIDRSAKLLTDDVKKAAEASQGSLNIKTWIDESHKLAKKFVYTKEMLAAVTAGEFDPDVPLKKVDLSPTYQEKAKQIANQRVAEAGYRLAQILKNLD